jgi:hypothetical protein
VTPSSKNRFFSASPTSNSQLQGILINGQSGTQLLDPVAKLSRSIDLGLNSTPENLFGSRAVLFGKQVYFCPNGRCNKV